MPSPLRALPRWVGWRAKVPLHPARESPARAGDPSTWGTFEQATAFYAATLADPDAGAGFEFDAADGLVGVDLDLALDERGEPRPWASALLWDFQVLGGAYAEVSPSGRGLHLICRANLPANLGRVAVAEPGENGKRPAVEVYREKRYFTVTGQVWGGLADLGPDATALVEELARAAGFRGRRPGERRPVSPLESGRAAEAASALAALDPDLPYPEWLELGMALRAGLGDAGLAIWDDWSSLGAKYVPGEPERKWATFAGEGVGLGTLFQKALAAGWCFPAPSPDEDFADPPGGPEADGVPYHRSRGRVTTGPDNIALYLSRDPQWKGRLRYNLRRGPELDGAPLGDEGHTRLGAAAKRALGWESFPAVEHVYRGVAIAAREHEYDPVQDYLRGLTWDGEQRIGDWLVRAGTEDSPATREIGRRWIIGAAGRGLHEPQPGEGPLPTGAGTKMDYCLVLEGSQGLRKSWVLEALCPPGGYFFDSFFDFRGSGGVKDLYQALGGHFIVEMAELHQLRRAEIATVRAIITSRTDAYRPPYGRSVERHPRRSVLTGTVNETHWIPDLSGGRRFWPVPVARPLDRDWMESVRDQLWAEAVAAYRAGEVYWEDDEMRALVEPLQAARKVRPGWSALVEGFLRQPDVAARGYVDAAYLVESIRGLATVDTGRLAAVLEDLGCRSRIASPTGGKSMRVWVLPDGPATHAALCARLRERPLPRLGDGSESPP